MASLSIYEKIGKNIDSLIFSKAVTTNNDKHSAPAANDHLVLDDDDDQDDDQDGHGDDSESYRSVAGDPNHNNDSIFAPAVELEEVDVVSGKETAAFAANPSGGNVINVTDGSGDNNDIWQNDFGNLDDDNIKDAKLSDDAGTSGLGKNGKARSNNALQIDGHIGVRIEELQLEMVIHNSVEETFDEVILCFVVVAAVVYLYLSYVYPLPYFFLLGQHGRSGQQFGRELVRLALQGRQSLLGRSIRFYKSGKNRRLFVVTDDHC